MVPKFGTSKFFMLKPHWEGQICFTITIRSTVERKVGVFKEIVEGDNNL